MEKKIRKKATKEIRDHMNNLIKHLANHCCATNTTEHNRILDLTYELE